jgi:tetratricopeptide (TPR) repeat protein
MAAEFPASSLLANRYRPIANLGVGSMGRVDLVIDTMQGCQVALKVILAEGLTKRNTVLQFKQEFRLMAQLDHPNCCKVFDYGVLEDESPYFTMEEVPGYGLDTCLPLPAANFRDVIHQLLLAVGHVHQAGFLHRDIKPSNVRLRPDGVVKLMDYGFMEPSGGSGGAIRGTVAYLAPEVIQRGRLDGRTDLYAVGCLAYELLTGQVPFPRERAIDVLRAHLQEAPKPPSVLNSCVDPVHERVVLQLLAKDPSGRPATAGAVLALLGLEAPQAARGTLLAAPLVGRESDLGLLGDLIAEVAAGGKGATVALTGTSGIGKTRLLETMQTQVQLAELPSGFGGAYAGEAVPYGPFTAILRGLLPALGMYVPRAFADAAPLLASIVPEVGVKPAAFFDAPSQERLRFQAALASVFIALSRARGLVLLVDGWQFADALSQEFLSYLCRNAGDAPLLVVLATTDATLPLPANATLQPLAPLETAGVARMVKAMLDGQDPDGALLAHISAHALGLPMRVEQLMHHLVRTGLLAKTPQGWQTLEALTPADLPLASDLVGNRIAALSGLARCLLQAAAVLGHNMRLDVLQWVSGMPDDIFFPALEEIHRAQLVVPGEQGAYAFTEDNVETYLLATMPLEDRRLYHARAAAALDALMPTFERSYELLVALAHHAIEGEVADKVVAWAFAAGQSSARIFANAQALKFLEAGQALIDANGAEASGIVRTQYLRLLGDVNRFSGNFAAARADYEAALALAHQAGDALFENQVSTSLAKVFQYLDDLPGSLVLCARSRISAEVARDAAGAARSLLTSCRSHYFLGDIPAAMADTRLALAIARTPQGQAHLAEALAFLGFLGTSGKPDAVAEGLVMLAESFELSKAANDRVGMVNVLLMRGDAQLRLGEVQAAYGAFAWCRRLCQEIGFRAEEAFAALNLGLVEIARGAYPAAASHAREGGLLAQSLDNSLQRGSALMIEGSALGQMGLFGESFDLLARALELAESSKSKYLEGMVLQATIEVLLSANRLELAAQTLLRAKALLDNQGGETELALTLLTGELLARQGDFSQADAIAQVALASARETGALGHEARALKLLAWIALQVRNWPLAVEKTQEALTLAEAMNAHALIAELTGLQGEAFWASGLGDAALSFETMVAKCESYDFPLLMPLALFGRAATHPSASEAAGWRHEARERLMAIASGLEPDAEREFLAPAYRKRICARAKTPLQERAHPPWLGSDHW